MEGERQTEKRILVAEKCGQHQRKNRLMFTVFHFGEGRLGGWGVGVEEDGKRGGGRRE